MTAEVVHDREELVDELATLIKRVDGFRQGNYPEVTNRRWKSHLGWACQHLGRAKYYLKNHVRR